MNKVFAINEFDNKKKKNHIIFICDHASNNIPISFNNLGLDKIALKSHISWDIGVKNFCLEISRLLKQSCFISNFSRLVIDPNRNVNSEDIIVSNSWGQKIPGNENLSFDEKRKRIENFYNIYHCHLGEFINKKLSQYKKVKLIAIHSFNKKIGFCERGIEIGLLFNKNINLLLKIQKRLAEKQVYFARNFPYSGFFYNYTLDRHSKNAQLDNISLEIRNDLICDQKGIKKYVKLFKDIFEELIND